MILVLFLVISLGLSAYFMRRTYQMYERVHSPTYGNWVIAGTFYWARMSISMISFTLAFFVLLFVELMFDGVSETQENVIIVIFATLGVLGILFSIFVEAEVIKRTSPPEDKPDMSEGYRHTN